MTKIQTKHDHLVNRPYSERERKDYKRLDTFRMAILKNRVITDFGIKYNLGIDFTQRGVIFQLPNNEIFISPEAALVKSKGESDFEVYYKRLNEGSTLKAAKEFLPSLMYERMRTELPEIRLFLEVVKGIAFESFDLRKV